MSETIVNGASQLVIHGEDDKSALQNVRTTAPNPIFFPVFNIYAARGEAKEVTVGAGDLNALFGGDTFDPLKKYFNPSTLYLQGVVAEGTPCRVRRLIPTDAGPIANAFVSVEILHTEVDDYERNSDGSIKIVNGVPVVKAGPKIAIREAIFHVTHFSDKTPGAVNPFGARTRQPGTATGTVGGTATTSEIWPLFDIAESSIGENGNLTGFSFFAPRAGDRGDQIDPRLIDRMKAYPFVFKLLRAANKTSTPVVSTTLDGAQGGTFTFKPGQRNTFTTKQMSFGETLLKNYRRMADKTGLSDVPGFISDLKVYDKNIADLLKILADAERAFIEADTTGTVQSDLTGAEDEDHRFNFLSGTTYSGYPYHTYRVKANTQGFRPTSASYVMLAGGDDGTMSLEKHAELVNAEMDKYLTTTSVVNNDAVYRQSVIIDCDFPLATKIRLLDVMANRKDIAVMLSCFTATEDDVHPYVSPSDYNAIAATLKARALLYPASTWFGTSVSKVLIQGGSGRVADSPYTKRTSMLYELVRKSARYMGAVNFKEGQSFTGFPGHLVEFMTDIDQTWAPVDQRVADWNVGLNQVMNYSGENDAYFPAVVTVHENDTSVLISWITNVGLTAVYKAMQDTHREFSGVDKLTKLQLKQRVETSLARRLTGRFDGRFLLEVEVIFTPEDLQRNYSWTAVVRLGANGTHTVMTGYIETYRWEDLAERQRTQGLAVQ